MSDTENKTRSGTRHRHLLTEVLGLLADIDRIMAPHRRRTGAAYRVDPLPPPPLPPTGPIGPDTSPRSVPRGSEAWRSENKIGPPQLAQAKPPPDQPLSQATKTVKHPSVPDPVTAPPNAAHDTATPARLPEQRQTPPPDTTAPRPKKQSGPLAAVQRTQPHKPPTPDPIAEHEEKAQTKATETDATSAARHETLPPPSAKRGGDGLPPPIPAPAPSGDPSSPLHSHDGAPNPKQAAPLIPPPFPQPGTDTQDPRTAMPRPAFGPPPTEPLIQEPEVETDTLQTPEVIEAPVLPAKKPRRRQTAGWAVHLTKAEARRLSKRLQRSFLERSLRRLT